MLPVVAYRRTNLTLRQPAPLFEVSESAADRVIDHFGPALALRRRERSKNRYSTGHQVVIDAGTRLVVAVGRPGAGRAGVAPVHFPRRLTDGDAGRVR